MQFTAFCLLSLFKAEVCCEPVLCRVCRYDVSGTVLVPRRSPNAGQHQLGDLRLGPCRHVLPQCCRRRRRRRRCAALKSALAAGGRTVAEQQTAAVGAGRMSIAAAAGAACRQRLRQHVDLDCSV
jgi:hypothetical protein